MSENRWTGEFDITLRPIMEGDTVEIQPWDDSSEPDIIGELFTVGWGWWDGGENVCKTWVLYNDDFPLCKNESDLYNPHYKSLWDGTIWGYELMIVEK